MNTNHEIDKNSEPRMKLSYRNLLVTLAFALIFELIIGFIIAIVTGTGAVEFSQSPIGTIIISITSNLGYMLAIVIIYGYRETLYDLFTRVPKAFRTGIKWALIAIIGNIVIGSIARFIYTKFGLTPTEQNITQVVENLGGAQLIITMLLATFIIPVFEEIIFRGILHRTIAFNSTIIKGIIFSSVIFGIMHKDWFQLPNLIFLGICFAKSYEESGSLYSPIAAHVFNNGIAMGLMYLAL